MSSAKQIIQSGLEVLDARAAERGLESERSMSRTVDMFNGLTGYDLDQRDGYVFMLCLKMARAYATPTGKRDDYVDGANYAALAGEWALANGVQKIPNSPRSAVAFGMTAAQTADLFALIDKMRAALLLTENGNTQFSGVMRHHIRAAVTAADAAVPRPVVVEG